MTPDEAWAELCVMGKLDVWDESEIAMWAVFGCDASGDTGECDFVDSHPDERETLR